MKKYPKNLKNSPKALKMRLEITKMTQFIQFSITRQQINGTKKGSKQNKENWQQNKRFGNLPCIDEDLRKRIEI